MLRWQSMFVLASVPLLLLLLCVCLTSAQPAVTSQLSFIPRTANASWSPRWDSNIEFYNKQLRVVLPNRTALTWPPGIFILQGNGAGSAAQRSNDGRPPATLSLCLTHSHRAHRTELAVRCSVSFVQCGPVLTVVPTGT